MDQITSAELSEWEAYDKIDPVGEWRSDLRMAIMASLMVNSFRGAYGKEGIEMTTPEEFMPKYIQDEEDEQPKVKKQSVEDMKQALLAIAGTKYKKVDPTKEKRVLKK